MYQVNHIKTVDKYRENYTHIHKYYTFAISRWTAARFVIKRFIHHQFPWLSNSWYCFDVLVCRIPHSCLKLYLFFSKVRPRFMLRVLFLLYSMLLPWRHNHLILLIRRCFTRLSPKMNIQQISKRLHHHLPIVNEIRLRKKKKPLAIGTIPKRIQDGVWTRRKALSICQT